MAPHKNKPTAPVRGGSRDDDQPQARLTERFLHCIVSVLTSCEVGLPVCEALAGEITEKERNAALKNFQEAISLLKRVETKLKPIGQDAP